MGNKREAYAFTKAADEWLSDIKPQVKRSTYAIYEYILEKHIRPFWGKYIITRITERVINDFILEKLTNGRLRGNGGLSKKYVQDIMCIVKSVIRFAERSFNIRSKVGKSHRIRPNKPVISTLNEHDRKRLTEECMRDTTPLKLGILFGLFLGLRNGEVCGLRWSDFDEKNGTITVNRTVQRIRSTDGGTKIISDEPKTLSSKRVIPLQSELIDKLIPMIGEADKPIVSDNGRITEPSKLRRAFKRLCAKCDISDMRFHDLRHTFAGLCIRLGFDIKMVSEILGHANVSMTLDRYVHPSLDEKRSCLQKLAV